MNMVLGLTLLAVVGVAVGIAAPFVPRGSLARRHDNGQWAVGSHGVATWHFDDPRGVVKDDVGGSAVKNAFMGEEQFLQQNAALLQAVPPQQTPSAANMDNDVLLDLNAEDEDSRQNSFAAEQPFLKKLSGDTGTLIRWVGHNDKCVCGKAPSSPKANATLVLDKCNGADDNQKFILPTGEFPSGLIKWKKDPKKCMYVHEGWQGNGNSIYLWQCDDKKMFQAMNFSIFTPTSSGLSAITWSKELMKYPSHCLDVENENNAVGAKMNLWDCSAGCTWQFGGDSDGSAGL